MTALIKLLDLLPGWLWALLLIGALAWGGVGHVRNNAARLELAELRMNAEKARADAERQQRDIEAQRIKSIAEVSTHAQNQINALEGNLSAARTESERLRIAAQSAARRACAGPTPALSGAREPDSDSIGMLSDVLAELDRRAGVYAEQADRLRVAGSACERSYDAVSAKMAP